MESADTAVVELKISRGAALTRGSLWLVAAGLAGLATYATYSRLSFVPSAISNRLVDYSIAILALPLPVAAIITLIRSLRWIVLALWKNAGIHANQEGLVFSLGPFGRRHFRASQIDIRYPFELLEDPDYEPGVEAFLPEEEQLATLLPRLRYPGYAMNLGEVILKFAGVSEAHIASRLSPLIMQWRSMRQPTRKDPSAE